MTTQPDIVIIGSGIGGSTMAAALALMSLFVIQFGVAFALRGDEAREIAALTGIAWGYLALAALLTLLNWRAIGGLARTAFSLTIGTSRSVTQSRYSHGACWCSGGSITRFIVFQ